jgi:hypothetical protein
MSNRFFVFTLALSFALGAGASRALATLPNTTNMTTVIADCTVQYPTNSAQTFTSFTNYQSGYNKIKFGAGTTIAAPGVPCKSYFKFAFNGLNPNTNYVLKFSVPAVANNNQTHCMIWGLNQSYAGFTTNGNATTGPGLSWWTAQANYTNTFEPDYNGMMTSGSYTATLLGDFIAPSGGSTTTIGFSIPAPWGQYLINDPGTGYPCLVFAITATNDPANGGNGSRWALQKMVAFYQPLTSGTQPPTISAIADQTVTAGSPSPAIGFTVSDPVDAASTLTNFGISFNNTNVSFTATNIVNDGSGNCTLTFTPKNNLSAGKTANVTVTLIITDNAGNSASSSFALTVPPKETLPVVLSGTNVNFIPPTYTANNAAVTIAFKLVETNANVMGASNLIVQAAVAPYTWNLGTITVNQTKSAGTTNDCSVTVTPTGPGVGIVNVSIIDSTNNFTNIIGLAVMDVPAPGTSQYILSDFMAYKASTTYSSSGQNDLVATNISMGVWSVRATASTKLMTSVASGAPSPGGVALIRSSAFSETGQSRLLGAPYRPGSHAVLYATFNATWLDIANYGGAAYYPSNSNGGFLQFAANGSSTGVTMGDVGTSVANFSNPSPDSGSFQLCLIDTSDNQVINTSYTEFIPSGGGTVITPVDKVAVSYDTDTGISKLWVNPSTANSTDGSAVSAQVAAVTNLPNVNYIVLRQNTGMGAILVSNLQVQVAYKPSTNITITDISKPGNSVTINYTDSPGYGGTASVVSASTVDGTYIPVSATINEVTAGNYTATITGQTGDAKFYRIKQTGTFPTVTFPF